MILDTIIYILQMLLKQYLTIAFCLFLFCAFIEVINIMIKMNENSRQNKEICWYIILEVIKSNIHANTTSKSTVASVSRDTTNAKTTWTSDKHSVQRLDLSLHGSPYLSKKGFIQRQHMYFKRGASKNNILRR